MNELPYSRTVGEGKTFLSPTDYQVYINTTDGIATVVLPKISTVYNYFTNSLGNPNSIFGFRFKDLGFAGVNKIVFEGMDNDKINGVQKFDVTTSGASGILMISSINNYTLVSDVSSISIPTVMVKVGVENAAYNMPNLFSYYLPTQNNDFLNYNPKYYLFMAKSKNNHIKRVNGVPTKMKRLAGFYHPTHQNGINFPTGSKFYSGETAIPLDSEFSLTPNPYTLTQIGFNPFQWTRVDKPLPLGWQVPNLSDVNGTILINKFKVQGKNSSKNKRSALFCLAIGIQNPDTTSDNPILFGELSQPFKLSFKVGGNTVRGFSIAIQTSNIHRLI